jgi:5-methylcytosine-specific restriction endonuclease McrA
MIPDRVRAVVSRRAAGQCEECGEHLPLEMHHLTYVRRGRDPSEDEPIFGFETPDDLQALCRACHHARHIGPDGEFYRDPEECAQEWDQFQHMMLFSS